MPDASDLRLRPIEPADRGLLADGFEHMGPESRYRRFFSPVRELSERQLDYLTEVDHHDHEAVVAIAPDTGELAGVARYVRTDRATVAEPAVAVMDDWQGRGVAGILLDALVGRAREEGIESFVAPILAQNAAAIHTFERLGDATMRQEGEQVELTIPLGTADGATTSLRSVLRQVATGTAQPAFTFWQRVTTSGLPHRKRGNAVVVGLPGPDAADRVVDVAAGVAAAWNAELHVVGARRFLLDDDDELANRLDAASQRLEARGVRVESHRRRGDLAASLIEEAVSRGARLIVVDGRETHSSAPLLGSAWDHVSHHAPCDVLIAR